MPQPRRRAAGPTELRIEAVSGEDALIAYRAVVTEDRNSEAFRESFKSSHELGLPPRAGSPEERFRAIHTGISCFDAPGRAASVARRWGKGDFIAELHLPPNAGFSVARWGSKGHMTIWGDVGAFVDAVVATVRIED